MAEREMTFWEHLDELRTVLIRIIVVWGLMLIALICVMPLIFDKVILAPCSDNFVLYHALDYISRYIPVMPHFATGDFTISLINIELSSQFFVHMSTSMWLALLLTFPYMMYELWKFIRPALYPNERNSVRMTFMIGNVMFYLGIAVGYFLVFPLTLRFLANYQISTLIPNQISLNSYMGNFLTLTFAMGIVFELPLLCKMLSTIGLIDRNHFKQYRRHAIVAILILSAVITPSGDPFTLLVVFLPIYMVYELSAMFVKPAQSVTIEN